VRPFLETVKRQHLRGVKIIRHVGNHPQDVHDLADVALDELRIPGLAAREGPHVHVIVACAIPLPAEKTRDGLEDADGVVDVA
jgi:hypothetical protein